VSIEPSPALTRLSGTNARLDCECGFERGGGDDLRIRQLVIAEGVSGRPTEVGDHRERLSKTPKQGAHSGRREILGHLNRRGDPEDARFESCCGLRTGLRQSVAAALSRASAQSIGRTARMRFLDAVICHFSREN
jgi:hypothetical protein